MGSNNKYALTFYLFGRLKIANDKDARHEIVRSVTNGRTEKLSELEGLELHELNEHLKRLTATPTDIDKIKLERQRRKFFSICHLLNWELDNGKLNYDVINEWLLKFGYLHKPLNEYTLKELPQLITQIESIKRKDYEKGKTKI